mgnify:CR=1 FL=1
MIVGIGIDAVEIDRVGRMFADKGERMLQRLFTADELAYIIVRITESFLYRDVLTGDAADIEAAIRAIRVLVTAPPEKKQRR